MLLKGKTILLGVTGGIAAYKSAYLASLLVKEGARVQVVMTKHALEFIAPATFDALTGLRCITDTFDRNHAYTVEHVSLAKQADAVIIAPATANTIAKLAHGLADDMLTTTVLACRCPVILAPAMNTRMYENPITQDNLRIVRNYGMVVAEPASGRLACGDTGKGKMEEPETLLSYVLQSCAKQKDMKGTTVLVTAGPTQESIDPVRYVSNHSTGKMGYAIAKICALRGADVTLVSGKTAIVPPLFTEVINVTTARQMYDAVTERSNGMDIIIKAAAVADYRPRTRSEEKMKKSEGELMLAMERTDDILAYLGTHKQKNQFICGFSMETEHMLLNSRHKLDKKCADMIVANNLRMDGAGFGTDTNIVTLITKERIMELEKMTKEEAADRIMDEILRLRSKQLCL